MSLKEILQAIKRVGRLTKSDVLDILSNIHSKHWNKATLSKILPNWLVAASSAIPAYYSPAFGALGAGITMALADTPRQKMLFSIIPAASAAIGIARKLRDVKDMKEFKKSKTIRWKATFPKHASVRDALDALGVVTRSKLDLFRSELELAKRKHLSRAKQIGLASALIGSKLSSNRAEAIARAAFNALLAAHLTRNPLWISLAASSPLVAYHLNEKKKQPILGVAVGALGGLPIYLGARGSINKAFTKSLKDAARLVGQLAKVK